MFILLEGPDHCGKTTLANEFKKYGAEVYHFTWNEEIDKNPEYYFMPPLESAILRGLKGELIVFDRHFLSYYVYAEVFRQKAKDLKMYEEARSLIINSNNRIIFCLPENTEKALFEFNQNKEKRNEMYGDMKQVHLAYKTLWGNYLDEEYDFNNKRFWNIIKRKHYQWYNTLHLYDYLQTDVRSYVSTFLTYFRNF